MRLQLKIVDGCIVALLATALSVPTRDAQAQVRRQPKDPFERTVPAIVLDRETMFEAVARIYESAGIVVSVERVLGSEEASAGDRKFTATIPGGKPATVLDEICALDGRYAWSRYGNMVNVYPRSVIGDANYLFNRAIPTFRLNGVNDPGSAAIQAVDELPGPRALLIVLEVGGFNFAKPWTVNVDDVTLRQAADRIAQHLCQTCGWQLMGTRTAPRIMFFRKLKP